MSQLRNKISWKCTEFGELDIQSLYEILQLRSAIFVVEQNCPYQDVDGKDRVAIHLQGFCNNKLVAYSRLFKAGDCFLDASIGRVVVAAEYRRFGFGHELIDKSIQILKEKLGESRITISGQLYLKTFYESHGFVQTSDEYLEDNIPHIQMKRY